jgi:hypothetical protein
MGKKVMRSRVPGLSLEWTTKIFGGLHPHDPLAGMHINRRTNSTMYVIDEANGHDQPIKKKLFLHASEEQARK